MYNALVKTLGVLPGNTVSRSVFKSFVSTNIELKGFKKGCEYIYIYNMDVWIIIIICSLELLMGDHA